MNDFNIQRPKQGQVAKLRELFDNKAASKAPVVKKTGTAWKSAAKQPPPKPSGLSSKKIVTFKKTGPTVRKANNSFIKNYLQHADSKRAETPSKPVSRQLEMIKIRKNQQSRRKPAVNLAKELALSSWKARGDPNQLRIIEGQKKQLENLIEPGSQADKEMKTVWFVANEFPTGSAKVEDAPDFDRLLSSLLETTSDDKEQIEELNDGIKKDANTLYGGDLDKAKLNAAKRLINHKKGGIDTSKHSPSINVRAKAAGFTPSVVKAAEKLFKHQVRGRVDGEVAKIEGEGKRVLAYKYRGKIQVIVEEEFLTKGSYKTVSLASAYFAAAASEQRNAFVSLEPTPKKKIDLQETEAEETDEGSYYGGTAVVNEDMETAKIDVELSYDKNEEEEYEAEVELTEKLQGPGFVKLHSVATVDGKKVMIQEAAGYAVGGKKIYDLAGMRKYEKMEKKLSPEDQKVKFQALYDAMTGLERMHNEFNLIHRDMKGLNVLVTPQGRGAVTDFGTVIDSSKNTQNTFAGTPQFAPPESAMGENITTKFDVWSTGMTILSLCCEGQKIKDHPVFEEAKKALIEDDPEAVEADAKSLDPEQIAQGLGLVKSERYEENLKNHFKIGDEPLSEPKNMEELIYMCTRYAPEDRPEMTKVKEWFKAIAEDEGIEIK